MNKEVTISRYVTESTFDAYLYQTIENKQKYIGQVMTSKTPVRSCEDVDETALSYAEIKALCAGNPLIKEKMDLDIEVARLRVLKADHQSQIFNMEDNLLRYFPESIKSTTEMLAGLEHDRDAIAAETKPNKDGFSPMEVEGTTYAEKEGAGKALLESCKYVTIGDHVKIGSYRGLDLYLTFNSMTKEFECTMKGELSYKATLGTDVFGNITRLNNVIDEHPKRLESGKMQLENLNQQMETARVEVKKPFAYAAELAEKEARLTFLNAQLDMGDKQSELSGQITAGESAAQQARASDGPVQKPSILEGLRVAAAEIKEQDAAATSKPNPAKHNDIAI